MHEEEKFNPTVWDGNAIVFKDDPKLAVAGLAPGVPEEWGPMFAAAPELYAVLYDALGVMRDTAPDFPLLLNRMETALAKARGETE